MTAAVAFGKILCTNSTVGECTNSTVGDSHVLPARSELKCQTASTTFNGGCAVRGCNWIVPSSSSTSLPSPSMQRCSPCSWLSTNCSSVSQRPQRVHRRQRDITKCSTHS